MSTCKFNFCEFFFANYSSSAEIFPSCNGFYPRCNIAKRFRWFFSDFLSVLIRVLAPNPAFFLRGIIFEWQIVAARPSALVEGAVARGQTSGRQGEGGRVVSLPPPRHYVTPARCFARRCSGLAGCTRAAKGAGRRRRSINIKLSVQHLPTSVATRATTRPARCNRIDFANTTWKTATCSSPFASKSPQNRSSSLSLCNKHRILLKWIMYRLNPVSNVSLNRKYFTFMRCTGLVIYCIRNMFNLYNI